MEEDCYLVVPPVTQYRRELVGCEADRHRLTPRYLAVELGRGADKPLLGASCRHRHHIRITFATIGAAAARKFPVLIGKTTSVWHRWWTSLLTLYPTSADLRALRHQRRGPVIGLVVGQTALASAPSRKYLYKQFKLDSPRDMKALFQFRLILAQGLRQRQACCAE